MSLKKFTDAKEGNYVFIVAEIGKNFIQTKEDRPVEEYLENAKKLINEASFAGADAVKFQTHEIEDEQVNIPVTSPHFNEEERYSWVMRNTVATLPEFWKAVKEHAEKRGIVFFSTPMSRGAAIKLEIVGVPLWKVGSGDVEDYVMLDYLIETEKPIIISTGMVSKDELEKVVEYIQKRGSPVAILYCVSKYPTPKEYFNLASIEYLKKKYPEAVVGFSDHSTEGHDITLAAIKLGARVIEKHFSLDRNLWGSDHKVSITPIEMKIMVEAIRRKEYLNVDSDKYYGEINQEFEGVNNEFRPYFKKTLVAARDILEGEIITKEMVYAMRPQIHLNGLPSHRFHTILGKRVKKALKKYQPFQEIHF